MVPLRNASPEASGTVASRRATLASGVAQPEQDHADDAVPRQGRELAEVEIERQQDPILGDDLVENLLIGTALATFVPKAKSVVSWTPELMGVANLARLV